MTAIGRYRNSVDSSPHLINTANQHQYPSFRALNTVSLNQLPSRTQN